MSAILPYCSTIAVAIITGIFSLKQTKLQNMIEDAKASQKKEQERVDKRAEKRAEESLLLMRIMNADTKLCVGVAMALKNGHANGEIEEGLEAVKDAQEAYQKFQEEQAVERLA